MNRIALKLSIYFIWVVQAVDIYWNTVARDYLAEIELNPIASAVIALTGVAGLSASKVVGTLIATEFLQSRYCPQRTFIVSVLVLGHAALLYILTV